MKEDRDSKAYYLAYIAEHAGMSGNYQLMNEALESKKKVFPGDYDYAFMLGGIGLNAAMKKQFGLVDRVIGELAKPQDQDDSYQKVRMLTTIAEGLLIVGEKERAARALQLAVAFKIARPVVNDPYLLVRLAIALAKAGRVDLLMEFAASIKVPNREYFAQALADLAVEFDKHRWTLDARQRRTLNRLMVASREIRDPSRPPLEPGVKKRRR